MARGSASARPPVLLPSGDGARPGTPRIVPALALIGLAVLCFWTLPAVAEHQRLQKDYAELQRKARVAQEAGRSAWQFEQALGAPIFSVRSGRGTRKL